MVIAILAQAERGGLFDCYEEVPEFTIAFWVLIWLIWLLVPVIIPVFILYSLGKWIRKILPNQEPGGRSPQRTKTTRSREN